jgi:excisionase family DNA binding protein
VAAKLRDEAGILRKWGASHIADVIDRCREAYEEALQEHLKQLVSLAEAASYSGYSKDHLRRLARAGELPVTRRGRRPFFELGNLPRKAPAFDAPQLRQYDVAADARQVFARRSCGGFHEAQEVANREGQ